MPNRPAMVYVAAAFMIHSLAAPASNAQEVKEFAEHRCKLTLPGPGFQWLDHSNIPHAMAALGDDSGTMLIMLANKNPEGLVVSKDFCRGFDDSFDQPGVISKISGAITTFRGVPCYQLHARLEQNGTIGTIRAFAANGYVYQLQLLGNSAPIEQRNTLDRLFAAFEFVGEPILPAPAPPRPEETAYKFSENMGKIAGYCIVGIILLTIAGKVTGRKKKGS